ncbi:MAG: hypothetical protein AAF902_16815 [Chloroflexota bacterium]
MGGFPTWTLIGMGICGGLSVLFNALAYLAQSPELQTRFRVAGLPLTQNGRRFSGLGLACVLVGMGFFMAGVPLESEVQSTEMGETTAEVVSETESSSEEMMETDDIEDVAAIVEDEPEPVESESGASSGSFGSAAAEEDSDPETETVDEETETTQSGAFSQPADANASASADVDASGSADGAAAEEEVAETEEPTEQPTVAPTQTPTQTSTPAPTATPSPTPTNTPTPTITPTAIAVDTVSVQFDGSVLWVYRVPNNQRLALVNNGDQLILLPGRAIVQGTTWQEVSLLDGSPGWIQLRYLVLDDQ